MELIISGQTILHCSCVSELLSFCLATYKNLPKNKYKIITIMVVAMMMIMMILVVADKDMCLMHSYIIWP